MHCDPRIDSASNENKYQEYFLGGTGDGCVGLITSPPSFADCIEIWKPLPPGSLRACRRLNMDCVNFFLLYKPTIQNAVYVFLWITV